MTNVASRVALLLILGVAPACSSPQRQGSADFRPQARALVARYVERDTSGLSAAADSLMEPGCLHDYGQDEISPTSSVELLAAMTRGDTVEIPVLYRTLGHLDDQSIGSRRITKFRPEVRVDTTRLLVVAKSDGAPQIVCPTFLPTNRLGISFLDSWLQWLDTQSRTERLKLTAHVGVCDFSPVRCSLSAIR